MREFAQDVIRFNSKILGIKTRPKGLLSSGEMDHLHKCLLEELNEFTDGHNHSDYIECIDSLIDLMYFAVGGLYKMGMTSKQIAKCAKIIHNCNMQKKKGVVARRQTDGSVDAAKPSKWKSPEELLAKALGVK
jgi:predicted HAD superfamily Cof-like phosphohydrolase